jgi:hypothetical protein
MQKSRQCALLFSVTGLIGFVGCEGASMTAPGTDPPGADQEAIVESADAAFGDFETSSRRLADGVIDVDLRKEHQIVATARIAADGHGVLSIPDTKASQPFTLSGAKAESPSLDEVSSELVSLYRVRKPMPATAADSGGAVPYDYSCSGTICCSFGFLWPSWLGCWEAHCDDFVSGARCTAHGGDFYCASDCTCVDLYGNITSC